tara:strand:- start:47 stop:766 length:720 start_codon:yes stop_codon:yes gene_type:complete
VSFYVLPEDLDPPHPRYDAELREARLAGASPQKVLEITLSQIASRKRTPVLAKLEEHLASGHKILLFTGRRDDNDQLVHEMGSFVAKKVRRGALPDGVRLWGAHGGVSFRRRSEIVEDYMGHPGPCVLAGTWQALGTSLNLQDTDAVFVLKLPESPGALRQLEGRAARIGQRRSLLIYYVIAEGTPEERYASLLIDKLPAVEYLPEDKELGEAKTVLAGLDPNESDADFASAVLGDLDE